MQCIEIIVGIKFPCWICLKWVRAIRTWIVCKFWTAAMPKMNGSNSASLPNSKSSVLNWFSICFKLLLDKYEEMLICKFYVKYMTMVYLSFPYNKKRFYLSILVRCWFCWLCIPDTYFAEVWSEMFDFIHKMNLQSFNSEIFWNSSGPFFNGISTGYCIWENGQKPVMIKEGHRKSAEQSGLPSSCPYSIPF